jgi:tetratricopeptide (TPR) repeat protein
MHWGLGLAHLGQGNVTMARQEFRDIGETSVTDRELQELSLAIADLYEGKLDAARADLVRQIQAVPARSGGLQLFRRYLVGCIHLAQGNSRAAELQADFMLQVPSTGLQASDLLSAGTLYARAGKIDKARQVLRRLDEFRKTIPSSSNQENFHNLEGEIQLAEAKPEQAAISFAASNEGFSRFISSAGLARAYQAQRLWDLSAQAWEKVISERSEILQSGFPPDLAVAHLQLAHAYGELNNRDLALKHYEEIVRMWQHADDLSILQQARHELEDLKPKIGPSQEKTDPAASGPAAQIKPNRRKVWIYSSL